MTALPWMARLAIALLLGFPALLLLGQAWSLYHRTARGWSAISGRVLNAWVEESLVSVRVSTSTVRRRLAKRYQPIVEYEYSIAGRRFQSRRLFVGDAVLYSSAADAEKALKRYPPPGAALTVWIDPSNPAEAVLQKTLHWQFWVYLLLGAALAIGAGVLPGGVTMRSC